ncbi:unnamed protein product [Trichobilharzia szidati]|nr:unnamed protein product [Trichobilharzia szidati]
MTSIKEAIMQQVAPRSVRATSRGKLSIIGVGAVGMAIAYSAVNIAGEMALIDMQKNKVKGEILDLQHGQQFSKKCKIVGGTDYKYSTDSDIVVITAGARQSEGESRLNLVQRNVEIFKSIIPNVVKYSPNSVIVVVSNPVDILTYVAQKLSGFPTYRVMGTGTMIDSARFRFLLGQKLGISADSINGYIIGEHGDSSVPVWSNVNVGGVRLACVNPDIGSQKDPEKFEEIHKQVVRSAYDIIRLKGYTSWAIGLTCQSLCNSILYNIQAIYPLSTYVKGIHGIKEDVYLSLPCLVNSAGISHVIPQRLNSDEISKLKNSATTLNNIIEGIKW